MATAIPRTSTDTATVRPRGALTPRALFIGTALLFGAVLWVRHSELLVHTINLTEATPPVPAVAALLLLAVLHPLLSRLGPRLSLTRREMVLIYFFVAIGSMMTSLGVLRMVIPCATAPAYFAEPDNKLELIQPHIPDWLRPQDPEVIRTLWEAKEGAVPWAAWTQPIIHWTLLLTLLWVTALCLTVLVRRPWVEGERLAFPLLYLPLDMTEGVSGETEGVPFFRDPVMWTGFLIAVVFNVANIANSLNPAVPAPGRRYDIGGLFTERPWSAIRPLFISHRPEIIGFGYLVSLEVAFSVWMFALAERLSNVVAVSFGADVAGFPLEQEQGAGAYLLIAALLLWRAREHIGGAARALFGRGRPVAAAWDPFPPRWALAGLIVAGGLLLVWCHLAGMHLAAAAVYLIFLFGFALTYMRVRCETGTPSTWLFPFYQARKMPQALLGAERWLQIGGPSTMSVWAMLFFLSRGFFFSSTAYPLESYRAAEELRARARHYAVAGVVAVVLGLLMAWWMHLDTYYEFGGNVVESGGIAGGPRTRLTVREYEATASAIDKPPGPDRPRSIAMVVGAGISGLLFTLRHYYLRFPLHPLGYAMAAAYSSQIWGGFLAVWLIKGAILRFGGVGLYKRLTPAFIGLALGHFFTMGIAWAIVGSFFGRAAERARVWFT
ncbi:MAG: DUF6785 family protein [Armatimonadota bacterium]|nr:DUF6785 family protein [Armatimonadota bacterium]